MVLSVPHALCSLARGLLCGDLLVDVSCASKEVCSALFGLLIPACLAPHRRALDAVLLSLVWKLPNINYFVVNITHEETRCIYG